MLVLVLNCGSSSLKYQLIDMNDESVKAKGLVERIGIDGSILTHKVPGRDNVVVEEPIPDHSKAVSLVFNILTDSKTGVIKSLDEITAIGHRVTQGGMSFKESAVVGPKEKEIIKSLFDLAPLHNPANLTGIEACEKNAPGKKNVAVFDTTFGMDMEEKAYLYAIPYKYYTDYHIRRYGFHGTSHMFVSKEVLKMAGLGSDGKVIVCHLGNGSSVSASIGGKCVDTSMGLTPLEGMVMGTRSGDIDPAALQLIMHKENIDIDKMLNILNKESGFLGLSGGKSSDCRDIQKLADEKDPAGVRALAVMEYRVAKYIGAYTAAMNGVDAIAFTAGIGENSPELRADVCKYLGYLGVKIDPTRNNVRGKATLISTDDSKIKVYLVPTNEELMIARETLRLTK